MLDVTYWRAQAQSYGAWPTLKRLGRKASNRFVPHATLVCLSITLQDVDKQYLDVPNGLHARFLRSDELEALCVIPEYGISKQFLETAFAKDDQCYGLLQGNRVAAFGWYSRRPTAENENLTFHFDSQNVYMYFGFTHPDFRGQRLHAIGMSLALREYTKLGYKGMVSIVHSDNLPSLRSCKRMGYQEAGRIHFAKIGSRYWIYTDKQSKRGNFGLSQMPAGIGRKDTELML